jgi:membrane protein DedA with SNARE-associated domain
LLLAFANFQVRNVQQAILENGPYRFLEFSNSFDPVHGPWIISVVVALESAGVPLPGETILVAAALLAAATNQIDITVVVAAAAAGAIVGDGIGYTVGRRFGMPLLRKYGRYFVSVKTDC